MPTSTGDTRKPKDKNLLHHRLAAPLLVLMLGFLCVVAASFQMQRIITANEAERFEYSVRDKLDAIRNHIAKHTALLRSTAGLFAANDEVSRKEFTAYVNRLRLRELYPGVQGLGFTRRVDAADLDTLLAFARVQNGPEFRVWPEEPRSEYHSIIYLEPQDLRNVAAVGFDMFTEPTRREAMVRARDTGRHAASGRVELVQEIDENKQPGFLIYLPVYEGESVPGTIEARQARLYGFVYSPYRAGDLFDAIFGDRPSDLDIAVYDGTPSPQTLLYRSQLGSAEREHAPAYSTSRPIEVGGRVWTVELASRSVFERGSGRELIPFVIGGGVLATLLLSGLAWSQARATHAAVNAREKVQQLNASLERRVAEAVRGEQERARALRQMEEQLRQSQKMEAVGQLTGGVAHDFNNLLTVIAGNLEMLQRRLEAGCDTRLTRYVANALEGAKRASILTHRLLAFSRQSPLQPEVVDLNKLVAGMSDLLSRTLGEHIAIETVLAAGLWRTEVDPNQLENAILNLAVNARDAMPDGGKLTIETGNAYLDDIYVAAASEKIKPGQYVMVCVSDTGVGMPPEVMARVFEPFFTTKPVGKGTGLGLAQVYGFMRQSGGHAAIYSEVGQGTTVKLYLPRLKHIQEPSRGAGTTIPNEVAISVTSGEIILVVEDDALVRQFSVSTLEDLGYRVLEAEDGPSALQLLDRHAEISLLFTDVVLAGPMNGRKVADEATKRRPNLKVLFTTGYSRNAIIHQGRLDEGVDLIGKPFTAKALAKRVRAILDR